MWSNAFFTRVTLVVPSDSAREEAARVISELPKFIVLPFSIRAFEDKIQLIFKQVSLKQQENIAKALHRVKPKIDLQIDDF